MNFYREHKFLLRNYPGSLKTGTSYPNIYKPISWKLTGFNFQNSFPFSYHI